MYCVVVWFRLLGGSSGWYRQQSGSSVLLEKMWTKVNMQPLSKSELREVINATFPQLVTVTDRLLEIYFLLSAGKHETSEEEELESTAGKFLSNEGRLISTRLAKTPQRIRLYLYSWT